MRWRHLLGLAAISSLTALATPACLALDDGELGFDPVDEDYTRPEPALSLRGAALERRCEESDEPPVIETPTPLLQAKTTAFGHALCLCGDLAEVGQGLVTRSRSTLAGADPGRGHVGVNGRVSVVGDFAIEGTLDVARGLQGVGDVTVAGDFVTGADVSLTGTWRVGRDAWISGDLESVGNLTIGHDLYLGGRLAAVGDVSFAQGHRGFAYTSPPCGCSAGALIDVAAEVAARREVNDNGTLPGGVGASDLVFDSGEFYFSSAEPLVGARSITVRGRTAIYLDGDLETVGDLDISVEPTAELELWIAGKVSTVGNLRFAATEDRPRAFKLFMGGTGASIMNVGSASFVGAIYAPSVDIEFVGDLEVHGSLFARSIEGTGRLTIVHDTDLTTPQECADREYKL